ncbi:MULTISPECIES: MFS transporter [unclassified Methanoregula]|uniref:MFS transporter n=1 Tax=unclassified Methanoregula TaxID=2649730 RepID=UPI0009C697BF|nr:MULTISPECIES: MFS transporter [unclassified Methanoregula]OPX64873.1 MAG: putative 3-hydroxyphenylpropionic transporter MhpT [Methanoregula sp. PtaB.Bin085]OPY32925.1 MAG: putative 3-hydroxyphenylpropionic transporter MhpT [Methanoregula sp. PtaU1.Bin006]
MEKEGWLNRTVLGAGITSFFSDLGHEAVTVLLPSFLIALGAPVYALGIIEGISDGASSFVKLLSGYLSDKLGKRREFALAGYVATGIFPAIVAVAAAWPVVLLGRVVGWMGRGTRGPPRDAILAKSVEEKDLGKAFGFHRAGDTLGAIAGPAVAFLLVAYMGTREIFWLTLIPGFLAILTFWFFVQEKDPAPSGDTRTLVTSLKELPAGFRKYLSAILVFGIADFSHTLLIAFAVVMLTPSLGFGQATAAGAILYMIRNIVYAAACYPFGALGDRFGRKKLLVAGYVIAVLTFAGFVLAPPDPIVYGILFALCGIFIAAEDTLESAVAGEMIEEKQRGLGFGALATMNGIGDLCSSILIGFIWAFVGYSAGFTFAAIVAAAGTIMMAFWANGHGHA